MCARVVVDLSSYLSPSSPLYSSSFVRLGGEKNVIVSIYSFSMTNSAIFYFFFSPPAYRVSVWRIMRWRLNFWKLATQTTNPSLGPMKVTKTPSSPIAPHPFRLLFLLLFQFHCCQCWRHCESVCNIIWRRSQRETWETNDWKIQEIFFWEKVGRHLWFH